ncbi:hypothetical protein [Sinosporangium siamense]|uniref:Uncharacterized protein n=1 Tax=Sinosporangium siamense TaxID=1367973 RepID=A0A919V667_9ACTN|nr:hypothetical protein [Sinosporangium siamense]GII90632.1 hypothetical protein Ssi02_08630 [Sinosporangium siamense]
MSRDRRGSRVSPVTPPARQPAAAFTSAGRASSPPPTDRRRAAAIEYTAEGNQVGDEKDDGKCTACKGKGKVRSGNRVVWRGGKSHYPALVTCNACGGSGQKRKR